MKIYNRSQNKIKLQVQINKHIASSFNGNISQNGCQVVIIWDTIHKGKQMKDGIYNILCVQDKYHLFKIVK